MSSHYNPKNQYGAFQDVDISQTKDEFDDFDLSHLPKFVPVYSSSPGDFADIDFGFLNLDTFPKPYQGEVPNFAAQLTAVIALEKDSQK